MSDAMSSDEEALFAISRDEQGVLVRLILIESFSLCGGSVLMPEEIVLVVSASDSLCSDDVLVSDGAGGVGEPEIDCG